MIVIVKFPLRIKFQLNFQMWNNVEYSNWVGFLLKVFFSLLLWNIENTLSACEIKLLFGKITIPRITLKSLSERGYMAFWKSYELEMIFPVIIFKVLNIGKTYSSVKFFEKFPVTEARLILLSLVFKSALNDVSLQNLVVYSDIFKIWRWLESVVVRFLNRIYSN